MSDKTEQFRKQRDLASDCLQEILVEVGVIREGIFSVDQIIMAGQDYLQSLKDKDPPQ